MPCEIENIVRRLLFLAGHDQDKLPVPVERIARERAEVRYQSIPHTFDGITVKLRGERPQIIINSGTASQRQRFTLAHELGHVIIPWHVGTIVDRTVGDNLVTRDHEYRRYETEANAFAAALLLPSEAVNRCLGKTRDKPLGQQINCLSERANVSLQFATVRAFSFLPPDIAYVIVTGSNTVVGRGSSPKSRIRYIDFNDRDPRTLFSRCAAVEVFRRGDYSYVYYDFRHVSPYEIPESTDWRGPLKRILSAAFPDDTQAQNKKYLSVNAALGAFFGSHLKGRQLSYDEICTRLFQYSHARANLLFLSTHVAFYDFIRAKALDFLNR